jgi:Carboxypeptidase regulatory-like domain
MAGDDRIRHCPQCNLNVYNFSQMNDSDVDRFIANHEGRLCARFYRRPDGKILTQNCPAGFRATLRRATRVAAAALTAVMSAVPALSGAAPGKRSIPLLQIQPAQVGLALEVVDPSGAFMPNAQIVIRNETTGKEILRETDATGQLRIADLPPGSYEITVAARYFTTAKLLHLSVPTKESVRLQLDLAVLMGEVVEVQGIETQSSLVPSTLVEPTPAKSQPIERPPQHHNLFQKLISGLRRAF